ncbi:CHAT domain-containing protein [Iningainema tapete]|uniref:PD40 domain-containing protein n=1 Tax=Iningainema tapete BLCC-T55 TaxID=2748662 RepID=A0A8J6XQ04_9CYAN|nr:CHAT domain-containing protein [Iningainema tapete]MBD2776080.1 PD40 domain-containing protein [Iningainema tapete BLCC-T55]
MRKLVVLKLDGDLEQGVRVMLEIGEEGTRPSTEIIGQLPHCVDLHTVIEQWRSNYRSIRNTRIKAGKIVYGASITQWREDCQKSANELRSHFNSWLLSESFRPIREKWLQQLNPDDEVRILIRTSSVLLLKLPWHLWDLVEEYPKAEVALSTPDFNLPKEAKTPTYRDKVKILAILGNSAGINVQKDRQLLENLPDAETTFLVEPQRQDINDQLWNQPWDILFFAGHSKTEGEKGRIYINQTDSLTIAELKYALRNAVAQGLQLAIFNSCDGLGLAFELQALHIPQMIVMREPVPDKVAQHFLSYFITAFAEGKSFYLAEREARLKLHGLENEFPCASWLPVIFQNPATVPPTWFSLGRRPTEICPYRGLFAFREEDAPFFFGREIFTDILTDAVQKKPLVAVIGPSGSGKSSVVFAGLIPRLRQQGSWHIVSFRPGDRPFHALAAALVAQNSSQMSLSDRLREVRNLAADLRQEEDALRDVVDEIVRYRDEKIPPTPLKKGGFVPSFTPLLRGSPKAGGSGARGDQDQSKHVLLVADQFEELYTLVRDPQERQVFLDRLLKAASKSPDFTLVITLRADFLGQALSYRPFADALQYADLKLGPMNQEELQAAVEQPATMLGVRIEQGLTERILDAVSAEPGDLPLLEFALHELWTKQRDAQLTHAAYEEIGGVEAALARYAEEAYGKLNEEEKERVRRLFIQLVRPGDNTEDTRRLATRIEVGEENWDLVTRLANARLVVSSSDGGTGEETVEIVHEALIGGWERLRLWLDVDRSFRTWQERLRVVIRQWEASGRDDGALLRGTPLAEAEGWLQSRSLEVSALERAFIQLSLELRDRERKQQEYRRKRTILALASGLAVVSMLALGAVWQWRRAEIGRTNAELSNLSATSEALFNSNQEFEALIKSIQAGYQLKRASGVNADTRMRIVLALQQAVYGIKERIRLQGHSATFSPDGKMLATASLDTIQIWSRDGRKVRTIRKPNDRNFADVSFSPDGKILATASYRSTIKLWDLDGRLLRTFKGKGEEIIDEDTRVSFSPNGKMLASASDNGTVKLWSLDGRVLRTFKGQGYGRVYSTETTLSFSPDGKMLAAIGSDGSMAVWNINGVLLKVVEGIKVDEQKGARFKEWTTGVSFSPDGKMLAIASLRANLSTVKLWSHNGILLKTLRADWNDGRMFGSISFSPDGKILATVNDKNTVKLWSLDNAKFRTLKANHNVTSIRFSPDGKMLVTAAKDNTVKLWKLDGLEPKILKAKQTRGPNGVEKVSFSLDGKIIATVNNDKTVKLWSRNGILLKTLSHGGNYVNVISFSPDGKMLALASNDGPIKLWSTDGRLLTTFKGHGTYAQRSVQDLDFSPDGKILALGTQDGTIKLWSTDGKELKSLKGHNAIVSSVSFNPDGKILASASWDYTVKLWSLEGTLLKTFRMGRDSHVSSVSFSPDGRTIALASFGNTVKLWSTDGREIKTLKGHNDWVSSVRFSPDGTTIASHSSDGTVKLWSIDDGRELKTFKSQSDLVFTSMSFSPDGKMLALGKNDGTVILNSLDLDELLASGCDWLKSDLPNDPQTLEQLQQCQNQSNLIAAAQTLVAQGEELASNGDFEGAVAKFKKAQEWNPELELNPEAKAAIAFTFQGKELARQGDIEGAVAKFKKAQQLAPNLDLALDAQALDNNPEAVANHLAAKALVTEGVFLAVQGNVKKAIATYAEAQKLDPKLEISADSWNSLCWHGSRHGDAANVMFACEKAVAKAPTDGNNRDSRGFARALTGDTKGAIEDFQAFIESTGDAQQKSQRQGWVNALRAGKNPFTPEEMKKLRSEQ